MPETESATLGLAPGLTPEQGLGMDVQRYWANGVQFTMSGNEAFLVFREQVNFEGPDGGTKTVFKNILSVVMPLETARQMYNVMTMLPGFLENDGEQSA
jgi:hypothetical protein